jgi:hypothetical protein
VQEQKTADKKLEAETVGRVIGFQHRQKKTKDGEERPTVLATVGPSGEPLKFECPDDLAELDFVHGMLPTAWRPVTVGENLSGTQRHHIHFRPPNDNETLEGALEVWPRESLDIETKGRGKNKTETLVGIPTEVPSEFDGVKGGDTLVGILGGSGFDFTIALIGKAAEVGAKVFLTAPHNLKAARDKEHGLKDDDADLLRRLYGERPEFFHEMRPVDALSWEVFHTWDLTADAMKQRNKVVQRAERSARHAVYASKKYIGSELARAVLTAKMGDKTVELVIESEKEAQRDLEAAVEAHPLYQHLFADIKGVGPRFLGKFLSAIRDIRRFPREGTGGFLRFAGYAVVKGPDGRHTIQRFRRGGGMPGNPEIKQAVWLLVDLQFSRQKDTPWGVRFQEIKAELHAKHPSVELICDTEIPLHEGRYSITPGENGGQNYTVDFGQGRTATFRDVTVVERGEKKTLVVKPETVQLPEKGWVVKNGLYKVVMPGGETLYRPGTSRYTKIHLHKIACWKLGTEFLIWLFKKWWEFVDKQEAERPVAEQKKAA